MKPMKRILHKPKGPFTELLQRLREKAFDKEEIVMDRMGLTSIITEDIKQLPNLQVLYIPNNHITNLCGLEYNIRLYFLDARNNQMTDFDLSKQQYMRELYLSGNALTDLDRILGKLSHMRDLHVLDLRGNPLTLEKGYRSAVIRTFPTLKTLDGLDVLASERVKPKVVGIRAMQGPRPKTMLQCLLMRPLSEADMIVQKKAEKIKKEMELRQQKEEEERTAAARKLKEEFEQAATVRVAPIPDGLDYLGMSMRRNEVPVVEKASKPRSRSRMYIKKPFFDEKRVMTEAEERAMVMNPRMPQVFNASLRLQPVFPE